MQDQDDIVWRTIYNCNTVFHWQCFSGPYSYYYYYYHILLTFMWGCTDKVRSKCVILNVTHLLNLSMYARIVNKSKLCFGWVGREVSPYLWKIMRFSFWCDLGGEEALWPHRLTNYKTFQPTKKAAPFDSSVFYEFENVRCYTTSDAADLYSLKGSSPNWFKLAVLG